LTRKEVQEAKAKVRHCGDLDALDALLRHSIAHGHQRLIVRRYLLGEMLGIPRLSAYAAYFSTAMAKLSPTEQDIARSGAAERAAQIKARAANRPTPAAI